MAASSSDAQHDKGLRTGRSCQVCGKPNARKKCGRCGRATYCSTACQRAHWSLHKAPCLATAKRNAFSLTLVKICYIDAFPDSFAHRVDPDPDIAAEQLFAACEGVGFDGLDLVERDRFVGEFQAYHRGPPYVSNCCVAAVSPDSWSFFMSMDQGESPTLKIKRVLLERDDNERSVPGSVRVGCEEKDQVYYACPASLLTDDADVKVRAIVPTDDRLLVLYNALDASFALVACVVAFDVDTGAVVATSGDLIKDEAAGMVLRKQGAELVVPTADAGVFVLDARSLALVRKMPHPALPETFLHVTQFGDDVYGYLGDSIVRIDAETTTVLATGLDIERMDPKSINCAVCPDGKHFCIFVAKTGNVEVRSFREPKRALNAYPVHTHMKEQRFVTIEFTPDGRWLVSRSQHSLHEPNMIWRTAWRDMQVREMLREMARFPADVARLVTDYDAWPEVEPEKYDD